MMKLGRSCSCLSRLHSSEKLLPGKLGGFGDASCITTVAHEPFGSGSSAARIFAPYTIFKGKAALSIEPVLPTFSNLDSGDFRLERRGVMMFTFWPSIGERKYDWDRRQHFGVSPTEVGSLLTMTQHDSTEFFHDPGMKSSNSGQVRKSLSVKAHEDGTGYFFSLSVQNSVRNTTDRLNVPVTAAEFAVLKTACSFALPHLMGWDRLTGKSMKRTDLNPPKVGGQLDLEWDK